MSNTNDSPPAQNDPGSAAGLYAYRSGLHKLLFAATLLIPYGFVGGLLLHCTTTDAFSLDSEVEVTKALRYALYVHGAYFFSLTPTFELFIDMWPMSTTGVVPSKPDNLYWQMTCLAGELFFVSSVIFFMLGAQTAVPRWTLIIPLAQTSYNLRNSLIWVGFGTTFSPIQKRIKLMALDALCIGTFFIIYVQHFFSSA
jgi:hypothetical protein